MGSFLIATVFSLSSSFFAGYSGSDMANLCREAALGPIRSIADIQCIEADQVPCYFLAWILPCFKDYFLCGYNFVIFFTLTRIRFVTNRHSSLKNQRREWRLRTYSFQHFVGGWRRPENLTLKKRLSLYGHVLWSIFSTFRKRFWASFLFGRNV